MSEKKVDSTVIENWLLVSQRRNISGELPDANAHDPNSQAYLAHFRDWDARKAEAVIVQKPVDPLLYLRALIFRGSLEEARTLHASLQKESLTQTTMVELLLEEARISAFDGEWASSLRLINTAMLMEPSPVTRLTLFQMRSLAYFELGDFRNSLRDLDTLDSLGTTFSNALTVTYGKILRARIMARSISEDRCEHLLRELWTTIKMRPGFSIDTLLTILRAEIDIRRFFGKQHSDLAFASWLVADSIGDKLYEALGRLDYYCSLSVENRGVVKNEVTQDALSFRRVNALFYQMSDISTVTSTTAQGLNEFWRLQHSSNDEVSLQFSNYTAIFFRECIFTLHPFKAIKLSKYKQICLALRCLKTRPSRAEFFKVVWGSQKYAPHLHDGLIAALCYRIKKISGVTVKNENSEMKLLDTLVLF